MKKFTVHYSLYFSDSIEVEATNETEAEKKVKGMMLAGEIGNPNEMDLGESNVWID